MVFLKVCFHSILPSLFQENELSDFRRDAMKETKLKAEADQYQKENDNLRRDVLQLQGEVYGARLAAKYLDKELAGRFVFFSYRINHSEYLLQALLCTTIFYRFVFYFR